MLSTLKALRLMPIYMGHLYFLGLRLEHSTTLDQLPRLRGQNTYALANRKNVSTAAQC